MHRLPLSCLDRFTRRDFEFIEKTLTGGGGAARSLESLLEDPDTLLLVLEQESLFRAVVEMPFPLAVSPEFYFFVLVRKSLGDAGIDDLAIADYVAATLAAHATGGSIRTGSLSRPDVDFTYQVDFLEAMEGLSEYERFFLQVHCGNRFLVLTGIFPGFLTGRAGRRGAPGLSYYEEVARNAFLSAADHPLADEFDVHRIYPSLAACLHETRRALNRMSENYLFLGA